MNNINLLWKRYGETSMDLILKVEKYFNVKFPKDYIEIINLFDGYGLSVKGSDGNYYEPMIEIKKGYKEVIDFFHFDEDELDTEEEEAFLSVPIIDYHTTDSEFLPNPNKMISFGGTAGKHLFVFDFRENEEEPSILFWNTDEIDQDAYEMSPEEYYEEYGEDIEVGKNYGFHKVADSFNELMDNIVTKDLN